MVEDLLKRLRGCGYFLFEKFYAARDSGSWNFHSLLVFNLTNQPWKFKIFKFVESELIWLAHSLDIQRYSKSPIPMIRRKFDEDDVAAIMSIHSASSTGDGKQSSEDEDYTQDWSIVRLVWDN